MNDVWLKFISEIVQGILLAIAPVIAGYAASWLIAKSRMMWAAFKAENSNYAFILEELAHIVVKAAEQAEVAENITEKKDYAVQTLQMWMEAQGYNVDLAVIEAAIEAAVYDEFNKQ